MSLRASIMSMSTASSRLTTNRISSSQHDYFDPAVALRILCCDGSETTSWRDRDAIYQG